MSNVTMEKGLLRIRNDVLATRTRYRESPKNTTANIFLYAEKAAGKTTLAADTSPGDVWIDCFDPGGWKSIRHLIDKGGVYVDDRYSIDLSDEPQAFALWEETFLERRKSGFFNHIGTYVLDSVTLWMRAMLNQLVIEYMPKGGRVRGSANIQDYGVLLRTVIDYSMLFLELPCNVVMIGHVLHLTDNKGRMFFRLSLPGQSSVQVPILFDEVWYLKIQGESTGRATRTIQTFNDGEFACGTRMGAQGLFDPWEKPNIKLLLKKAGLPYKDKQPLTEVLKLDKKLDTKKSNGKSK